MAVTVMRQDCSSNSIALRLTCADGISVPYSRTLMAATLQFDTLWTNISAGASFNACSLCKPFFSYCGSEPPFRT